MFNPLRTYAIIAEYDRRIEKARSIGSYDAFTLTATRESSLRNFTMLCIGSLLDYAEHNALTFDQRVDLETELQAYELLLADLDFPHDVAKTHNK